MKNFIYRRAREEDSQELTSLALRSKSHWGYSKDVMELFRPELEITPDYLLNSKVWIACEDAKPIGFVGLSRPERERELVYLFIEPEYMGAGIGKSLWCKGVDDASSLGWDEFRIISDRQAEPFYLKMGAVRVGEMKSELIAGRTLPVLKHFRSISVIESS